MKPIRTKFVHPPVPNRSYDWSAVREDGDKHDPIGRGETESEAVEDLLMLEQLARENEEPEPDESEAEYERVVAESVRTRRLFGYP